MAASGIHRYLKNTEASWSDKLKVARYAWVTETCYIPNKYQILLNWSCHAISHADLSGKDGKEQVAAHWTYLREILQSKAFTQEPLTIPASFYNALHRALLEEKDHNMDILLVTQELFTQPQLCGKLLAKADSSIDILSSLLRLLREEVQDGKTSSLLAVTEHVLKVFSERYKFRVINKKVFEDVAEKVLLSCLYLHKETVSVTLCETIERFLAETLFSEDLLPRYEDYLYPKKGFESATSVQKMVESVSNTMDLMKKILQSDTMNQEVEGVLTGIPLLYQLFITSLRPRPDMSFQMLKKYLEVLGFSESKESWEGSECQRLSVMNSLHSLLDQVHRHEIYLLLQSNPSNIIIKVWRGAGSWCGHSLLFVLFDSSPEVLEDEAAGGKSKAYLKHLTSQVVALNQWDQPSWYTSLQLLFSIDYNLLTKHQSNILRAALSRLSDDHRSDEMKKLQDAKLSLLIEVSDTYLRMRQFPAFCTFLIKSCSLQDSGYPDVQLPTKFLSHFGSSVQTLPLQMSLTIWKSLKSCVAELASELISELHQETSEPPVKKKRKKLHPDPESCNRLEGLGVLLGTFIRNTKVVEFSGVPHGAKAVRAFLQEMVTEVLLPCMKVIAGLDDDSTMKSNAAHTGREARGWWGLAEEKASDGSSQAQDAGERKMRLEPFVFTVLFVTCCHGDVRLLLHNYLRNDGEIGDRYDGDVLESGEVHHLHSYLSKDLWKVIVDAAERFGQGRVKYLLDTLVLQQIKLLIMLTDESNQKMGKSLTNLVSGLCSPADSSGGFEAWSGIPYTITKHNYQTARLHQLIKHYPMLSSHMSEVNSSAFVSLLCQSLYSAGVPSVEDSCVSGWSLAVDFLGSDICMDSRDLHNILVSRTLRLLSANMYKRESSNCGNPDVDLMDLLQNPGGLHQHIKQISSGHLTTDSHSEKFDVFIKVLSAVPIKLLSVENQTLCLLALHVVDFHLTSEEGALTKNHLRLLSDVRRLATEFIREVPKTDILCQVNLKTLITELVTSHLKFCEKVLTTQSCESLVILHEVNRHTSELLFHWLRRESVWAEGTSPCIKSLTKKLKTLMEANVDDALSDISLVSLAAIVLKYSAKHPDSLPSNFHEYASSLCDFLNTSSDQVESSHQVESSDCPLVTVFAILTITDFHHHVNDIKSDAKGAFTEDRMVQNILGPVRASWVKRLLLWLPRWLPSDQEQSLIRLIKLMIQQGLKLIRILSRSAEDQTEVWSCVYKLLGDFGELRELSETMKSLIGGMDAPKLQQLMTSTVPSVKLSASEPAECLASLQLWQLIPYTGLQSDQAQVMSNLIPQLLDQMTSLVQEINAADRSEIIAKVFNSLACVIGIGKAFIDEEDVVSLLSLCLLSPLDKLSSISFPGVFQAVCRVVNGLMQTFPRSLQKSSHGYVACLQHLLQSVMRRGQQAASEAIPDHLLVLCAEDMERLLSCFASFKETKQVGCFLLATFFEDLPKGTLLPAVKKILVLGMYHLVASADFKSLDSVQSMMPDGLREMYKSFIEDFHKYHRFKGNI